MVVRQLKVAAVLVILCSLIFSYSVASSLPQKFTVKPVPDQKTQTVKKPLKAKIVSGYCCIKGDVEPLHPKKCQAKRGTFYISIEEAREKCTGYCCRDGKVSKMTKSQCSNKGDQFYGSRSEANKQCNGWCCSEFKVTKATEATCKTERGDYFGNKAQADKYCSSQKGWCCTNGKVERLDASACKTRKGLFYITETLSKRNCKEAKEFCNIVGRTVRLTEKECVKRKGSWFSSQALAKKDLRKLRRQQPALPRPENKTDDNRFALSKLSNAAVVKGGSTAKIKLDINLSPEFKPASNNFQRVDPVLNLSFLPDLVVQKIYLDNQCRIHMVVKNQGTGPVSDEDFQNSQFGLSSWVPDGPYTPIVEASLTISDPLPMTQLDPGGILKNPGGSLDFNSKLVLQQEANIYGVVDAPYGHFFEGRIAETNNMNNGLWNRNVRCHKPKDVGSNVVNPEANVNMISVPVTHKD